MKAIAVGILASFFFAFTFVLNQQWILKAEAGFGVHHYGTTLWFQCCYLLSCIEVT